MNPERGEFGRVAWRGDAFWCRRAGDEVILVDRPPWEAGAAVLGEAALADVRVLAPTRPTKVIAVGLNYRAHADELAMAVQVEPILFMKPPSAVIGPGATIVRPPSSAQVDYEAELAVVIGRRGGGFSASAAADYIAGYTCANDVTARDLQKRDGQWTRAKSFDSFCPLGPWIVTTPPPATARVSAAVSGVEVQFGFVGDMIVNPFDLVAFVAAIMTLEPGDVVLTGTPPGVGPLQSGDSVTVAVEGVGELTNPVS